MIQCNSRTAKCHIMLHSQKFVTYEALRSVASCGRPCQATRMPTRKQGSGLSFSKTSAVDFASRLTSRFASCHRLRRQLPENALMRNARTTHDLQFTLPSVFFFSLHSTSISISSTSTTDNQPPSTLPVFDKESPSRWVRRKSFGSLLYASGDGKHHRPSCRFCSPSAAKLAPREHFLRWDSRENPS